MPDLNARPTAEARAILEEAHVHLERYKAIKLEFTGAEAPAEKSQEADREYAEFERLDAKGKQAMTDA